MKASKLKFILLLYDDVSIIFDEFFTTNHPIRMSERLMNIMISIITFYNPFFLFQICHCQQIDETKTTKTNEGKTNEAHLSSNFLKRHISRY